jgi:hypothetical protein
MTHALFIIGNSRRFLEESEKFQEFLALPPNAIRSSVIRTAYLSEWEFHHAFLKEFYARQTEPLLLVYNGHGEKEGWAINEEEVFSYHSLVSSFLFYRRLPTIVVNNCCFSGALSSYAQKYNLSWDLFEFIFSADSRHVCCGGLFEDVAHFWSEGTNFLPETKMYQKAGERRIKKCRQARFGADLELLFFKKKAN